MAIASPTVRSLHTDPPRRADIGRPRVASILRVALPAILALVIVVVFLRIDASNPPGFYRDESNIATNAAVIAESGRDEHGRTLPLYFQSHGDWKSAPYIYLLAGVFLVTGPEEWAARALSAALGLAAVAVLGVLGYRISGDVVVGAGTAVLAAATPWLFEVSRLVFEVTLVPLLVASLLLLLQDAQRNDTWSRRREAAIGATIASIAYAYAGGRALAPLLAAGLVVFGRGGRWRSVVRSLAWCALSLVPMAVFALARPRALFVRYGRVNEGAGPLDVVANLLRELDLVQWAMDGDGNARHHVGGFGSLLVLGVILAVIGVAVLVRRRRWDPFWSYVVFALVAAGVPAAVSDVRVHALRSVAMPVVLVVLAVPAISWIRREAHRPAVLALASVLGALGLAQVLAFHAAYAEEGPARQAAFHAAFPRVFRAALEAGDVAVHRSDPDAEGNATWYARQWDASLRIVEYDERPRRGEVVVATSRRCSGCEPIAEAGGFVAYLAR